MAPRMIKTTSQVAPKNLITKPINRSVANPDSIEAMTRETDRMVTGTFKNVECPGQPAKISTKLYPGQDYFCRVFEDGERTTIPLSIARFINERVNYDQHSYITDEAGNPIKTGKKVQRYLFSNESF